MIGRDLPRPFTAGPLPHPTHLSKTTRQRAREKMATTTARGGIRHSARHGSTVAAAAAAERLTPQSSTGEEPRASLFPPAVFASSSFSSLSVACCLLSVGPPRPSFPFACRGAHTAEHTGERRQQHAATPARGSPAARRLAVSCWRKRGGTQKGKGKGGTETREKQRRHDCDRRTTTQTLTLRRRATTAPDCD